jgi:hypothetical protein
MRALIVVAVAAASLAGGSGATTSGSTSFRVTLAADDHAPQPGRRWHFVVKAIDPAGRPVGGTAVVRVLSSGRVVDTIGWFRFTGVLRRTYWWSTTLGGSSAVLQATVLAEGVAHSARFRVRVSSVTGEPRFRAALAGDGHAATAGTPWHFAVHMVDASGRGVGGTTVVRLIVGGRVADTLGWFAFDGVLRRTYRWAPRFRGASAVLQARVIGPGGTRTVRYGVRVR